VAAAFTALRLIGAYAATGACRRALLIVVEQAGLHYELAAPAPVPDRHAAVALLLEETPDPDGVLVRQHRGVPPDEVRARLRADIAELSGTGPAPVVVTGGGLADLSTVDESVSGPAGQPYTGVWWELAARMAGRRRVLLADYDPAFGYLCTAAVSGHVD
jgi:4-hydroxymandelate oxidase